MNAISLFSGVGMFDLGVSLAGFNIIAQVELDDFCRKVLKRHASANWPNSTQFMDVRDFGRHSITGDIDLIFGGFPCQPFSVAGSRQAEADDRNMWPEFFRIISAVRPRAVMLENVPGLAQATQTENGIQPAYALTVVADLATLGYDAKWGVISAADAGAPHERKRWWLVAYASGAGCQKPHVAAEPNKPRHNTGRNFAAKFHRYNKPRMGGATYGITCWLDKSRWPAYQGQDQASWEAARTTQSKTPYQRQRIHALGNGGMWHIAYNLAIQIKRGLQ